MGPEYYRVQADDEELEFDQNVRERLLQGFRLVKELEDKVDRTPEGKLGEVNSAELRSNLAISSMDIIATFNETARLLLSHVHSSPATSLSAPMETCIALPPQKRPFSMMEKRSLDLSRTRVECGNNAESPLSSTRNEETSPLSRASRALATAKGFTPSPRSSNSEMSDSCRAVTTLETGARAGETAENDGVCIRDSRDNPRKRKLLPKLALRMPANTLDQGVEIPPDDGHTWRKYGQKVILCATYPRSYYRCTHKPDLGCQAIKQVQRCDDNSAMFDVTYRGHHTCRSVQVDQQTWPFAFPHRLSQANTQFAAAQGANLPFGANPSALSVIHQPVPYSLLSGIGSIPFSTTGSLTLTAVRGTPDGLVVTPKFGTGSGQIEPGCYQSQHAELREGRYEYSDSKDPANQMKTIQGARSLVIGGSSKLVETQKSSSAAESGRLGSDKSFDLQPKAIDREGSTCSEIDGGVQKGISFSSPQDWSLKDANTEATPIHQIFMPRGPSDKAWSVGRSPAPSTVRPFTGATITHRTAECSKSSPEEVPACSLFDEPMDLYPEIQLVPRSF